MRKPNINTIKAGERVYCKGFTCIPDGDGRTVFSQGGSYQPQYFICCSHGHHMLDGQANENGDLVGLSYDNTFEE